MCKIQVKKEVEKWDVFEITAKGKSDKNPFVDYKISGTFTGKNETVTVDGFYDGEGIYKVRFMPSFEGDYSFRIRRRNPLLFHRNYMLCLGASVRPANCRDIAVTAKQRL